MVGPYIKNLLFEHECVILPGFGGFLTRYNSADIHPITHKFQPPSRKVAFNEQLKNNDDLLVNAIVEGEEISRVEAQGQIDSFISTIREKLAKPGIYELKDVGRFFMNRENQIEFEPDNRVNYLEDSYSLPELFFKPIERNTNSMNKVQRPVKPNTNKAAVGANGEAVEPAKKTSPVFIILPIIILILGGATAFMYLNQDNKSLASVNPFVIFGDKEEVKDQPDVPKSEPAVDSAATAGYTEEATAPAISPFAGRFFVVAGSFKNRENAEKLKTKLENKSITATIIDPRNDEDLYRVSVADFDSKDAAKAKLKDLKAQHGRKIWILTY